MPVALLLPLLNVASTRTAAAETKLDKESKDRETGGDPHEDKHLNPDLGFEVQFRNTLGGLFENNKDDGCEDGCDDGA